MIEETILKYRKIELERIKRFEEHRQVLKIYSEMNKEIQKNLHFISEKQKQIVLKQINNSMMIDNRASLPDIFQLNKTCFEFFLYG